MNWIELESDSNLKRLIEKSYNRPQLIYKHSTRCGRCMTAKKRLEESEAPENIDFHYLDLWQHRDISNEIATDFDIRHESPQVILIVNGKSVYSASHWHIHMEDIEAAAKNAENKK